MVRDHLPIPSSLGILRNSRSVDRLFQVIERRERLLGDGVGSGRASAWAEHDAIQDDGEGLAVRAGDHGMALECGTQGIESRRRQATASAAVVPFGSAWGESTGKA